MSLQFQSYYDFGADSILEQNHRKGRRCHSKTISKIAWKDLGLEVLRRPMQTTFTRYSIDWPIAPNDVKALLEQGSSLPDEVIKIPESSSWHACDHAWSPQIVVLTGSLYFDRILSPLARLQNAIWPLP